MELFYSPNIFESKSLGEEESKHCVRVLRHGVGDEIMVIDGEGGLYRCSISVAHPKRVDLEILDMKNNYAALPYDLEMAVAPTKNMDRFEWFVEKSTEIGVARFSPLLCHFSERKVIKNERVERIIMSASKQSYKATVPKLAEMQDVKQFIKQVDCEDKFIAHCYDDIPKEHLFRVCSAGKRVVVMIGPEGDFSRDEVEFALANGFKSVSLGDSRLRTETAGVVAVEIVSLKNI